MILLVTGCCGFIGSNFVQHMIAKYPDYRIINLDKLTYAGNPENLKIIENNPNYKFVKGDIVDKQVVESVMKDCDAVVNFAAESHVDRSINASEDFIKTNILGTSILLDAAKKFNIKRFIQIGTDEVYGSLSMADKPSTEEDSLKPRSPYSASKASADCLALAYYATYSLPVVVTRSSNNYGPYQFPEKLIPLFITNLIEGKKVPLMGKGENVRDWLYVQDNCEAIDLVLHAGEVGQIYNIGGDNERTNMQVTEAILKPLNKDRSSIQEIPHRLGHDFRYSLNCDKIKMLGWRPTVNFESGILRTVDWYRNNEQWWRRLKK